MAGTKTYTVFTHVPEISDVEYAGQITVKMYASDGEIMKEAQLVYGDDLAYIELGPWNRLYPPPEVENAGNNYPHEFPYPTQEQATSRGGGDWLYTLSLVALVVGIILGLGWFFWQAVVYRASLSGIVL